MERIFPNGMSHLPEELKSLEIYCTTRACEHQVQYLGRAEEKGFKFAIFRVVAQSEKVAVAANPAVPQYRIHQF